MIVNKYNNEYHSIVEDTQRIERILQGHSQTANQTQSQQSMQHIENIPSQSDTKVKFIENAMKISWFEVFELIKKSWNEVSRNCIINCWKKTGLIDINTQPVDLNLERLKDPNVESDNPFKQKYIQLAKKDIDWSLLKTKEDEIQSFNLEQLETTLNVAIDWREIDEFEESSDIFMPDHLRIMNGRQMEEENQNEDDKESGMTLEDSLLMMEYTKDKMCDEQVTTDEKKKYVLCLMNTLKLYLESIGYSSFDLIY